MATATDDGSDTELVDVQLPAGSKLGAYCITRRVGSGGMAVVYAAQHQSLGKNVAIKILQGSLRKRPAVARRFLREGEAAARLSHPNVVEVFDVGTHDVVGPYLVMEFLDGEDLGRHLARRRRLPVQEIADLMIPVLSGVVAAHAARIVHRDLKPDNIFLCSRRGRITPKVVDFGVSKLDEASPQLATALTESRVLIGTPSYMSPEQARGDRHVDHRTDQFSLGVILYECATGKRPFVGDSLYGVLTAIVEKAPARPSKVVSLPVEFERLIMRALSKRPDDRFASTRELGRALLGFASANTQANYGADFAEPDPTSDAPDSGHPPLDVSLAGEPARVDAPVRVRSGFRDPMRLLLLGGLGALVLGALVLSRHEVDVGWSNREPSKVDGAPQAAPLAPAAIEAQPNGSVTAGPASTAQANPPASSAAHTLQVVVSPAHALITLDGRAVAVGSFTADILSDGREHQLSASAPGYEDWSVRFESSLPVQHVALKRRAAVNAQLGSASVRQPVPSARKNAPRVQTKQANVLPAAPAAEKSEQPAVVAPGGKIEVASDKKPAPKGPLRIDTSDPYTN